MDSHFPIGPGNIRICQQCVEHLKHDVDHRLADKLEQLSLPTRINGNVDEWAEIKDLLRLRRGQRRQMGCMEGE